MFKINNKDTRTTPMFRVNNKDTRTTPPCSSVSIVNFEQVIASWVEALNTAKNLSKRLTDPFHTNVSFLFPFKALDNLFFSLMRPGNIEKEGSLA